MYFFFCSNDALMNIAVSTMWAENTLLRLNVKNWTTLKMLKTTRNRRNQKYLKTGLIYLILGNLFASLLLSSSNKGYFFSVDFAHTVSFSTSVSLLFMLWTLEFFEVDTRTHTYLLRQLSSASNFIFACLFLIQAEIVHVSVTFVSLHTWRRV